MTTEEKTVQTPQDVAMPDYPELPPRKFGVMTEENYISERVNQALKFYDKSSRNNKNKYLRIKAVTVIGGAVVPVLVNIDEVPYINIITTIISLIVVLLVSLESVYHHREQWTHYRSAEQNLRNEYFLFAAKGGTYGDLQAEQAFRLFVDRTEEIIEAEGSSTLKVMTTVSETRSKPTTTNENGTKGD